MELNTTKRGEVMLGAWARANGSSFVIERSRDVTAHSMTGPSMASVGMFTGEKNDAADIKSLAGFFELGGCVHCECSPGEPAPAERTWVDAAGTGKRSDGGGGAVEGKHDDATAAVLDTAVSPVDISSFTAKSASNNISTTATRSAFAVRLAEMKRAGAGGTDAVLAHRRGSPARKPSAGRWEPRPSIHRPCCCRSKASARSRRTREREREKERGGESRIENRHARSRRESRIETRARRGRRRRRGRRLAALKITRRKPFSSYKFVSVFRASIRPDSKTIHTLCTLSSSNLGIKNQ